MSSKKADLSKETLEELLKKYKIPEIAEITGYGKSTVWKYIKVYGLNKKEIKPYSQEELEYIESNWGAKSINAMAKYLGRTPNGVRQKGYKIGLGDPLLSIDGITINELAKSLGIHYWTIKNWIEKYNFPVHKKIVCKEQRIKYTTFQEFWRWAEHHKNLINFNRFELNILGKEPYWVDEKRKADSIDLQKKAKKRSWAKEDDIKLINMLKTYRYTYKDLSEHLNRTQSAIKRRIYDLKTPYRPVSIDNHNKWTKEEKNKLRELAGKGYGASAIASKLNRSELSIYNKIKEVSA